MRNRVNLGLLAGFLLGLAAPFLMAARNGAGTYTLPAGNPVVTGQTISSTWANNTLADISTELTNSLDRGGRGAMTAPLQLASGSGAAPSLAFSAETNSGLYRAAANDIRMQVAGTALQQWTATTSFIAGNLSVTPPGAGTGVVVTGGTTSGTGLSVTGGAPNGAGLLAIGSGSGTGIIGTGGATGWGGLFQNGVGGTVALAVAATGASNAKGIVTAGDGTGAGVETTGGGSAVGLKATGGAGQAGARLTNGTAATGGTRQDALVVTNGDLNLDSVAAPTSTTAVKNRVTPVSFAKSWGNISIITGTPSLTSGHNITSVGCASNNLVITFAQAFTGLSNYAGIGSFNSTGSQQMIASCTNTSATVMTCQGWSSGAQQNLCAFAFTAGFTFVAYGLQ